MASSQHRRARLVKRNRTGRGAGIRQQQGFGDAETSSSLAPDTTSSGLTVEQVQNLIQMAVANQDHAAASGSTDTSQPMPRGQSAASPGSSDSSPTLTKHEVQQMIQKTLAQARAGASSSTSPSTSDSSAQSGQTSSGAAGMSGANVSSSSGLQKLKKLMKKSSGEGHPKSSSGSSSSRSSGAGSSSSGTSGGASSQQSAAQVLTQAQDELSQELEANLVKLKSVIHQSQEIAKKIEMVLGQGDGGSGSSSGQS